MPIGGVQLDTLRLTVAGALVAWPSDAVKVSIFSDMADVDFVYTPQFDPDRTITGRRISYFSPMLGRRAGEDAVLNAVRPDSWFGDDEVATRISISPL